jgi:hypothetical protein
MSAKKYLFHVTAETESSTEEVSSTGELHDLILSVLRRNKSLTVFIPGWYAGLMVDKTNAQSTVVAFRYGDDESTVKVYSTRKQACAAAALTMWQWRNG